MGGVIVDAAMKVHSALDPGLLESAHESCQILELRIERVINSRSKFSVLSAS